MVICAQWIANGGAIELRGTRGMLSKGISMIVHGVIRGMSLYYANGLERIYIAVDKGMAGDLPHQDHQRIEVILLVGKRRHRVGIRTTPRDSYVWIGPHLDDGTPKLAELLEEEGFTKNQRVLLHVESNTVRLTAE
jgi:hypothetical protein